MAALENIRTRAGLLVSVVIGLALLSFILGDLFKGGTFRADRYEIAEISGHKVDYRVYQQRIEDAIENVKRNQNLSSLDDKTTDQIKDQVWNQVVQENVLNKEFAETGITVCVDELKDMVMGNNILPQIKQIPIFKNQQTGQFDPNLVRQFILNLDQNPKGKKAWLAFEKNIKEQQERNKYYSAIQKGIYITDVQAKEAAIEKERKVDIKYIAVPLSEVKDADVKVTDDELQEFYDKHKSLYKQDKSVDIVYVDIPIVASKSDVVATKNEIKEFIPELAEVKDYYQYVSATSDGSYDGKFYAKGEYPDSTLDSIMFTQKQGYIYGPYRDGNSFKITKLAKVENRPDSVKIRQIVLVPDKNNDIRKVYTMADSLRQLINDGADFGTIARKFSVDKKSAKKGGDLGWQNVEQIVYGQALLDTGLNKVITYPTKQGVFIAEMTKEGVETKQVQLATIERTISASSDTRDSLYKKANIFGINEPSVAEFLKGIKKNGMIKKLANNIKPNTRSIAGITKARALIRAAFSTDAGEIISTQGQSQVPIFELGNNYVVAYVKAKHEKGVVPYNELKATIEQRVKKEKKAQILADRINSKISKDQSIEQIADAINKNVKESSGISFSSFSVPGLGIEPKVQGVAFVLDKDQISKPIKGNNGVYVIQVTKINEPKNLPIAMEKKALQRNYLSRIQREIIEILKENANIVDRRIKFF